MKKAGFLVPGAQVLIWNNTHKKGKRAFIAVLKRGEVCPMPYALCPMPYARRVPHVT